MTTDGLGDVISVKGRQLPFELDDFLKTLISETRLEFGSFIAHGGSFKYALVDDVISVQGL